MSYLEHYHTTRCCFSNDILIRFPAVYDTLLKPIILRHAKIKTNQLALRCTTRWTIKKTIPPTLKKKTDNCSCDCTDEEFELNWLLYSKIFLAYQTNRTHHWNGGHESRDFSVDTEHQWSLLFITQHNQLVLRMFPFYLNMKVSEVNEGIKNQQS